VIFCCFCFLRFLSGFADLNDICMCASSGGHTFYEDFILKNVSWIPWHSIIHCGDGKLTQKCKINRDNHSYDKDLYPLRCHRDYHMEMCNTFEKGVTSTEREFSLCCFYSHTQSLEYHHKSVLWMGQMVMTIFGKGGGRVPRRQGVT
jgi:hypothetical protein